MTTTATAGAVPSTMSATASDRARQVFVLLSLVCAILAGLAGGGYIDSPLRTEGHDVFAAPAGLLNPDPLAWWMWPVLYLGMGAYTLYQVGPAQSAHPRHRRCGWPFGLAMLLTAVWVVTYGLGETTATGIVMAVLWLVTLWLFINTLRGERSLSIESACLDVPAGMFFGWSSLVLMANIGAIAGPADLSRYVEGVELSNELWAVTGLVIVSVVAVISAVASRGRISPSVAIAWGLVWIAVARLDYGPVSHIVTVTAFIAAAVVLFIAAVARMTHSPAPRPGFG